MLAKRIISCLDVDHGRVVKGKQFQNLRDVDDPVKLGNGIPNAARMSWSFTISRRPMRSGRCLWM